MDIASENKSNSNNDTVAPEIVFYRSEAQYLESFNAQVLYFFESGLPVD